MKRFHFIQTEKALKAIQHTPFNASTLKLLICTMLIVTLPHTSNYKYLVNINCIETCVRGRKRVITSCLCLYISQSPFRWGGVRKCWKMFFSWFLFSWWLCSQDKISKISIERSISNKFNSNGNKNKMRKSSTLFL